MNDPLLKHFKLEVPQGLRNYKITSLMNAPPGATELDLNSHPFDSLVDLPLGVTHLKLDKHRISKLDVDTLLTAAYCDAMQTIEMTWHEELMSKCSELLRAVKIPVNKRPARTVCVVLSSSSVPRVGKRAAVRRLNRADLVREMAEMLDVCEPWGDLDEPPPLEEAW